jgi:hypothetical protein
MRFTLAIICLVGCSSAGWAQYGVSNQRDMYGNLARDSGTYAPRGVNQGPVNNGPIRNAPTQPTTINAGTAKGTAK